MSDHSETSSFNGEWEQMSDSHQELVNRMERLEREMNNMKIEMDRKDVCIAEKNKMLEKKNEYMDRQREKLREMREESESQAKEINALRSQIEIGFTFSLEEWMKAQIECMQLASVKLNEKILEVYKKIWEKGVAKAGSKSSSARKNFGEDIQKLENLGEEISKDFLKNSEECLKKIQLNGDQIYKKPALSNNDNDHLPIDSFLGTYTLDENEPVPQLVCNNEMHPFRTFTIAKDHLEGHYKIFLITDDGKICQTVNWIPDNVEREKHRVWIEGNILKIHYVIKDSEEYELTEKGMKLYGKVAFIRA